MKLGIRATAVLAAAAALLCSVAAAQAPGEDPVTLKGRMKVEMMPTGPAPTSGQIEHTVDLPPNVRARIARYEARSFGEDKGEVITDNDAVKTSAAQGLRKTCVQEVGSATTAAPTAGMKYGPGSNNQQIVVLRGDLVNICN